MDHEEVSNIVAPSSAIMDKVVSFLEDKGVSACQIRKYGDAIQVRTSAAAAEAIFNTDMFEFTNVEEGNKVVKQWGAASLPDEIHEHVEFVSGLSGFPMPARIRSKNVVQTVTSGKLSGVMAVIPQTIYSMYGVPPAPAGNVSQGVIEFQGQYFSPQDLATFGSKTGVQVQPVPANQIIGTNDPSGGDSGVESTLDIEMVAAVNTAASNWFWIEDPENWLYEFGVHFATTPSVPSVISISYAWWEGGQCTIDQDYCQQNGVNSATYVARTNVELQKIGLRGVAVFVASGDSGANGRTDESCLIPSLRADFPSSSPYVTSVGATQITKPQYSLNNAPAICTRTYLCPSGGDEVAVSYDQANFASGLL